jgi:dTDP-4-amino-4,6-dideoxygalactose transaminase
VKDHGYYESEHRSLLELEALYTYVHHRPGWNYRLTEMQSALGLTALPRMEWNVTRRRENAHHLTSGIKQMLWFEPAPEAEWAFHSFYKYYAAVKPGALRSSRDEFVQALRAEGIPVGLGSSAENYREEMFQQKIGYGHTHCPYECPWYEGRLDYAKMDCPNARKTSSRTFVLQVHPTAEITDMDDVLAALAKVGQALAA